jgi:hypothetical protein
MNTGLRKGNSEGQAGEFASWLGWLLGTSVFFLIVLSTTMTIINLLTLLAAIA